MHASGLEVADIFHQAGSAYRQQHAESLSRGQRCVMSAIERCQTALSLEGLPTRLASEGDVPGCR